MSDTGNGTSPRVNRRILRDLGVFHPEPRGIIVVPIEGRDPVEYPVMSVIDLKEKDVVGLMALDQAPQSTWQEQTDVLSQRIKYICPSITDEALEEMTRREKNEFWLAAMRERPPSVLSQLTPLLDMYARLGVPCDGEACEHAECWAIRELGRLKEDLVARLDPQEGRPLETVVAAAPPSSTT